MNLSQFKDPVSHLCLAVVVFESCFLREKVTGLNTEFSETFWKNSNNLFHL